MPLCFKFRHSTTAVYIRLLAVAMVPRSRSRRGPCSQNKYFPISNFVSSFFSVPSDESGSSSESPSTENSPVGPFKSSWAKPPIRDDLLVCGQCLETFKSVPKLLAHKSIDCPALDPNYVRYPRCYNLCEFPSVNEHLSTFKVSSFK